MATLEVIRASIAWLPLKDFLVAYIGHSRGIYCGCPQLFK